MRHPIAPRVDRLGIKFLLAASLLLTLVPQMWRASQAQAPEPIRSWQELPPHIQAKVDPRILAELAGEIVPTHLQAITEPVSPDKTVSPPHETRFLVYLTAQTNLELLPVRPQATSLERRTTVVDALVATAQATQSPVKAVLDRRMAGGAVSGYMPFYVFNGFAVQGNLDTVIELAQRDDVARLSANYRLVHAGDTRANSTMSNTDASRHEIDAANWNIGLVGAERVWDQLGITGQGAVVASFDTGVDWAHPALRDPYRGTSDGLVDHNYNWFEFNSNLPQYWDTHGNYGPSASSAPYDCETHGTHTTGTIVGDGGTPGKQIGMAPDAAWIAVPGICGQTMPGGYQDDIGGIRTFQWLMCPTDLSGNLATRDCSQAPDVINNSWGSSNPADNTFQPIIRALRAAGIVPVFASGNPSSGPGSIGSPASVPEAIAVGATDSSDRVTSFSGRGPSIYEGVQKPELSAPGASILSSVPGTQYATKSGTSMAAPHVSGLVALMISADLRDGQRDLDVDQILNAMALTSVDLGLPGPDDDYGYGRINAYEAVNWVLSAGEALVTVHDTNSGTPIADAQITLTSASGTQRYSGHTDASGRSKVSVPGGTYTTRIEAFGYAIRSAGDILISTSQQTAVNVELAPLSAGMLIGYIHSGQVPVPDARVYVDSAPNYQAHSTADGVYSLRLPVGTHNITVQAQGYQVAHATVTVQIGTQSLDVDLVEAPALLLVEADGYKGWYEGRPARQFFQSALDARDYLYDTVVITDTTILPQLANYDLVIWSHTVGSPGIVGYGTHGVLQEYLDGGGRLILSGQNIGYWDQWRGRDTSFYRDYLHAVFYEDDAALEGDAVSGSHFLSGIQLPLNDAAQYGYPNSITTLSPDGVGALNGNAYPILNYDDGNGAAALAIDPCEAPYRVVYLSVGYENLGPRATGRPPQYAELLDKAIQWAIKSKPAYDVSLSLLPLRHSGNPGVTVRYTLTVANTGFVRDTYDLSLSGSQWPTRLIQNGSAGAAQDVSSVEIVPCDSAGFVIEVEIPTSANPDDQDTFTLTATSRSEPSVVGRVEGKTTVLSRWQSAAPMPTLRYQLAAAAQPNSVYYYAIGGIGGATWDVPQHANERYDACSNQWTTMAPMPTARGFVGAATIQDKVYVAGGYAGGTRLDLLEIYDIASDTWSSGPRLPEPLSNPAAAAWNGRLYLFGGLEADGSVSDKTYVYDTATQQWAQRAPMPGGPRALAAAAALDGKLYVAGGWYVNRVEVYDPQTDTWSLAASLNVARHSLGMTAAPDGRLYVAGGSDDWLAGLRTVERYDPAQDRWELLNPLSDSNRSGTALAYADGRIWCTGGRDKQLSAVHESLRLGTSFCQSTKSLSPEMDRLVQPGDPITYTIDLYSNMTDMEAVSLLDPVPQGTTFAGFTDNPVGAVYSPAQNQVEWHGSLAAGAPPQQFSYIVNVNRTGWEHGGGTPQQIVNQARFDSTTAGQSFTRVVTTSVDFADPYPSTKRVSHALAQPGETLTYTLTIENASPVTDVFHLVDPLPPHTTYLPDSLSFGSGQGHYDPAQKQITWSGVLPIYQGHTVSSYRWGDSNGGGTLPGAKFVWQDMSGATHTNVDADDGVLGPFPIGFTFDFYGEQHDEFYVSPNGWVGFGGTAAPTGLGIVSCGDYGGPGQPDSFIGGFGGDRAVWTQDGGSITYKLFGSAPHRFLVVQFTRMRYVYNQAGNLADMQIWLHEGSSNILVQYQNLTTVVTEARNGIEGAAPGYPHVYYQDRCPSTVMNGLAILYEPILVPRLQQSTQLTYVVTTDQALANYTWITNTATLSSALTSVQRSAGTLVNPVDLSASIKAADRLYAVPGEHITYTVRLNNSGLLPAQGATLVDPIPPHTTYVPDSAGCSDGTCSYAQPENEVRWSGEIGAERDVTLTFAVTLASVEYDAAAIVNEATLKETSGQEHKLQAVFIARTSDLSQSSKRASAARVDYGETLTYTIQMQNLGQVDTTAVMRDRLPDELTFVPNSLWCASGSCTQADGVVSWQGTVPGHTAVPVRFQVSAPDDTYLGSWLVNEAVLTDTVRSRAYTLVSYVRVGDATDWMLYLPLVLQTP